MSEQRNLTYWACPLGDATIMLNGAAVDEMFFLRRVFDGLFPDGFQLEEQIIDVLPRGVLDSAEAAVEAHEATHGVAA